MKNVANPPQLPGLTGDTLVSDLYCVKCGYNLRGLPFNSRCPECALCIADSLDAYGRAGAQPTREQVHRAAAYLAIPATVMLANQAAWCASVYVSAEPSKSILPLRDVIIAALWILKSAELCSLLLGIYGVSVLTQRRFPRRIETSVWVGRKIVRVFGLAAAVPLIALVATFAAPSDRLLDIGMRALELSTGAVFMTLPPLVLGYLAALMRRYPAVMAAWLCAVTCAVIGILNVLVVGYYATNHIGFAGSAHMMLFSRLTLWQLDGQGAPLPGLAVYRLPAMFSTLALPLLACLMALIALQRVRAATSAQSHSVS